MITKLPAKKPSMKHLFLIATLLFSFLSADAHCVYSSSSNPLTNNKLKVKRVPTKSGFDALIITFEIKSDVETFKEVISDVSNYHTWVYNCLESKPMSRKDKTKRYYISKIDFPSPMKDRIFAAESTQYYDEFGKFISISRSITEEIDHGDFEPFDDINAKWQVQKIANGKLSVEYYVSSQPGGSIPSYVYNLGVEKGPVNSVKSLIKRVEGLNNK